MTTAGKVFTVLSFLLAIVFMLLVTPVVKHLVDLQKDVQAIEFGGQDSRGMVHRPQQEIEKSTVALDAERVQLTYELNREKTKVGVELTRIANQKDFVSSQLSILTDLEKAERASVVNWQDTARDVKAEIDARKQERGRLEQQIADLTRERNDRDSEVAALQQDLEKTRDELTSIIDAMQENYEKLERLAEVPQSSESRRVTAGF